MKIVYRTAAALVLLALIAGATFYWNPLWVNDERTRYHLWRSHTRSEYTEVNGYRIHYFEAVPSAGSPAIPLVLLHGLGGRGEDWSPLIPTLAAAGFHVYAPDLLGYGRSAKPDVPYSIPLEESVVIAFLHNIHLSRADVAGWSMGGWVAARLALDHPETVDRLVLYDSAGIRFTPSFTREAFVPADAAAVDRLMALLTPKPHPFPAFVMRATLRRVKSESRVIQRSMDTMVSGTDLLDTRLPTLRQPTLILWGMADTLIPPTVGQTMHRDIPNSTFIGVTGCGHLAPSECPQPFLHTTIQFLQANPPLPPGEKIIPANP